MTTNERERLIAEHDRACCDYVATGDVLILDDIAFMEVVLLNDPDRNADAIDFTVEGFGLEIS